MVRIKQNLLQQLQNLQPDKFIEEADFIEQMKLQQFDNFSVKKVINQMKDKKQIERIKNHKNYRIVNYFDQNQQKMMEFITSELEKGILSLQWLKEQLKNLFQQKDLKIVSKIFKIIEMNNKQYELRKEKIGNNYYYYYENFQDMFDARSQKF